MLGDRLEELEAGAGLVGPRGLGEEEREIGCPCSVEDAGRGCGEGAFARPELEPRLAARILHRRSQLGALRPERLVDDDEHTLAGAEPARPDQVLAPAWVGEALH